MDSVPFSSQQDAVTALVEKSKRRQSVAVRKSFLQRQDGDSAKAGVLHRLVRNHDERAFDLLLLALLVAVREPFDIYIEAGGWARMLGLPPTSGRPAISKTWKRLLDLQLISRRRQGRLAVVTLLAEDGSGSAYIAPGTSRGDRFLKIPLAYWTDGWYEKLDFAAKAMLLIALSLSDDFYLPSEKVPLWYGISADSAERGLHTLDANRLLTKTLHRKPAPLTTQGWTVESRYTLKPPFGPRGFKRPRKNGSDAAMLGLPAPGTGT